MLQHACVPCWDTPACATTDAMSQHAGKLRGGASLCPQCMESHSQCKRLLLRMRSPRVAPPSRAHSQGGVWTVTENVTTPFGTLPVRNQLVRPSTRVPQDYEDIQAFAPGPRGFRRLLEYAIREVDHEARESGNKVVYMVSCSYPCGFLDIGGTSADFQRTNGWIRSPSVREEHRHAFGNSPDTLELIDAIERPHTVEGTYKPGKVKVISLWRDPLQCVASTTGRSGSRQAFQGFLKQVTALQTELVVANAHVAALDPASWVRLNYTAYYSDIEGTARLLLRWLHLDEAMAVPAGQKLTGARLGGRNLQGQKGVGDEEAADVHKRSSGALSHALGQRAKNKRAASGRGAGVAQHGRGATPEDVVPEDRMAEDAMAEEVMPEDTRRQGGPRRDAFSATMRSKFTTRELDLVNALFYRKNQKALWADLLREDRALERVIAAN